MRLTEKDDLGHWFLKGLEWGQLREGKVITKAVAQKLYGALCKLKDYEDTGCNSDDVERLNDFTQNEAVKLVQKLNAEEKKHRWIPVEERLPELGEYVLISFSNFSVPAIGRYDEDEEGRAWFIGDETESLVSQYMFVNAWMPLPKPYRAEVEEKRLEDVMRCPYCNYIPECNEQTCAGCEIYEDFLDDINDLY